MYYFSKIVPAPKDIEYTIIESLEALGPRFALVENGYQGALSKLAELGKKVVVENAHVVAEEEAREMVQGIVESSDDEEEIDVQVEEAVGDDGEESESEDEEDEEDVDEEQVDEEDEEDFDEDAREEANEAERQFEQEFSRMMKDSLESRKHAQNMGIFDLAVPKTRIAASSGGSEGVVSFTMLSRGKQQVNI
jgi:regulator of nonsense transcripts 2